MDMNDVKSASDLQGINRNSTDDQTSDRHMIRI